MFIKLTKKKYLVLDDAVNIDDFKKKRQIKYKNTCVYIGGFFEGKGVEQIFRLAKKNKNIYFHIYGEKKIFKIKKKKKKILKFLIM